jgi:transcriptional regulator with XRE-family HTH domain
MDNKIAFEDRCEFSQRLKDSLTASGLSTKPSDFVRAFNARADGAAVSVHAVRKWLGGEAIPTHEKIVILAVWLGVNAGWLQFGDADTSGPVEDVIPEASISTPMLALVRDILSLPEAAQLTIRGIVDSFIIHFGAASTSPNARQGEEAPKGKDGKT